ncbi:relaxase/mobilization nuclease domain-containing protein [Rheinheimera sp. MM224]|uniref:relaxase/mobilization nuclease domain-containing protein n=1 Tax=Rheinheimera sp. MM224 TaxID=3019969 RepID=UPI0021F8512A|nr:relaxase/mobilization nuclease domain-containing protein [Rheinheimera sp. MM224]CAI3802944.1 hypothetical protein JAMGFMIE_03234 [Rheinheimera sp. MM224]
MIVKLVAAPFKRAKEARRIELLIPYITNPEKSNSPDDHSSPSVEETCNYFSAVNYFCNPTDINALCQETIDLAEQKHSNAVDVINHLILTCDELRNATNQDIDFVVNALITKLNLLDCQYLYGRHDDSESTHIHLMINRVNPATYQTHCINNYPALKSKQKTSKLHKHKSKVSSNKPTKPTYTEIELKTGFENTETTLSTIIAPIVDSSRTWGYLHLQLRELGMSLSKTRCGFVITAGSHCLKTEIINQRFSKENLESRFGTFVKQLTPITTQFNLELPETPIQLITDDKLRRVVFQIYLQEREAFFNLKAFLDKSDSEAYEKEIEDYKIVINSKLKQLVSVSKSSGDEIAKNLSEQLEFYKIERQAYWQKNSIKLSSVQAHHFDKWCAKRNIDFKLFYQLSAKKNLDEQRLKIRLDRAKETPLDRIDYDLSILPAPEPEVLFGWINSKVG